MLAAIIVVLSVVLDQVTKLIVVNNMGEYEKIPFIDGFMSFKRVHNTGGGWSILDGGGFERFLLIGVSVGAMAVVAYILAKFYRRHILMNLSLAMILGGGIGNMIDRIRLQYVVDFFHTEFIDFPTFNVADCFISVGAVLLAVYILFFDAKVEKRLLAEKQANESLVEPEADADECQCEAEECQCKGAEGEATEINTEEKGDNE